MRRKAGISILLLMFLQSSCSLFVDDEPAKLPGVLSGPGIFIANEGNYMAGNGSLSFYSFDSSRIYNNIFEEINNRPLGDIPNSITAYGGNAFIVVNNSGKIEVVDMNTAKALATIREIDSPRYLVSSDGSRGYVTSLYSEKVSVVDMKNLKVTGTLNLRRVTESGIILGNRAYFTCWADGNEVMVVDTRNHRLIDSIEVGKGPESIVSDINGRIWVLCSGSYTGQYYPELLAIDTGSLSVVKRFVFSSKSCFPTSLTVNNSGDSLFYIERGIYSMSINASDLPDTPVIEPKGRIFYRIDIMPGRFDIFATNAVDYQQNGYLMIIKKNGAVKDSLKAGIIPGNMCYKKE